MLRWIGACFGGDVFGPLLRLHCLVDSRIHVWYGALDHQNPALRGRATYELSSQMLVFSIFLEFVIATYVK